ncbi:branched-chain amino acid ABC transporter substrate-binding protein [Leeia sp. TBRC 13508]|uniref:Branched-chain amino acid ABC transporter substrate-binding protein n=1 Tax=Leeia speluncae TaxID=2884804 RepID=A0ABS8D8L8_9NEIS|nr:branched-chain amino acid ABC transporter substrate-binding protein [Leeia speluncae]MCB6184525.1 branched-chain amino acid ABC transporter substrate-binding protein [Leeia speluncae]
MKKQLTVTKLTFALAMAGLTMTAGADTIKIGFSAVMSGAFGHYGKDMENAAKIAIEEANAQKIKIGGSVANFVLVSEDDQGDPRTGVAVAQRLVDAGVVGIVGHFNSGTSIPASKIYAAAGLPQISPASSNPQLTAQGFKSTFRIINTDAQMGAYAGSYAVKDLKAKRIAVIDDRTAFGQGMADEFSKAAKAAGGNIVSREFTTDKSTDFMSVLTAIKSAKADLIFFGGLDAQAGPMAKQMKQLGVNAVLMGGGGFTTDNFINLAGKDSAEGTMSWEYGLPVEKMPKGKQLEDKMKKKFGTDILAYSPFTYDATWALINAMTKANSADPKVYLPALAKIDFPGVSGRIAFTNTGDMKYAAASLYKVKAGKWETLQIQQGSK